jgi:hypothetical protein
VITPTLILPHQGGGEFFRELDATQLCCGVLHPSSTDSLLEPFLMDSSGLMSPQLKIYAIRSFEFCQGDLLTPHALFSPLVLPIVWAAIAALMRLTKAPVFRVIGGKRRP